MKLALVTLTTLAALAAAVAGGAAAQPPAGDPPMQTPAPYAAPGGAEGMRGPPSPEMRAARQAMRESCAADVARVCPDAQVGGAPGATPGGPPRMGQCLRAHIAEVSDGCRTALRNMRGMRRDVGAPNAPAAPAPGM